MQKDNCNQLMRPLEFRGRIITIHFAWIGIVIFGIACFSAMGGSKLDLISNLILFGLSALLIYLDICTSKASKQKELDLESLKCGFRCALKDYRATIINMFDSSDRDTEDILSRKKVQVIVAFAKIPLDHAADSLLAMFMILGAPAESDSEDVSMRLKCQIQKLTYELANDLRLGGGKQNEKKEM